MQAGTGAVQSALRWEDCTRNTAEPSTSTCALRSPATPIPGTSRRCSTPGSPSSIGSRSPSATRQASRVVSQGRAAKCHRLPMAVTGLQQVQLLSQTKLCAWLSKWTHPAVSMQFPSQQHVQALRHVILAGKLQLSLSRRPVCRDWHKCRPACIPRCIRRIPLTST